MADDVTIAVETKCCARCAEDLPVSAFWKMAASPDGLQRWCKLCLNKGRRERDARYTASGKQARTQRHKDYVRNHGITLAEVDAMATAQNNRCALCGNRPGRKALHLDHDHGTGRVRKLLCGSCNRGLGYFQDDPDLLVMAALYITSHRGGGPHG